MNYFLLKNKPYKIRNHSGGKVVAISNLSDLKVNDKVYQAKLLPDGEILLIPEKLYNEKYKED